MGRLQLALDIGGTFTDVVMVDGASGALWTAKTPSTPRDPSDGFFDGVEKILRLAGTAPADVAAVFHGLHHRDQRRVGRQGRTLPACW
jgi:N-methylhydantoinase A